MYVARILFPVRTLGPGNRIAIWVSGCSRACPGCANPELWVQRQEQLIRVDCLVHVVRAIADSHTIDGITITGGEPLDQLDELAGFLDQISDISKDILVYTGYKLFDLPQEKRRIVAALTAVVIDGAYREELNIPQPLMGSANQEIHFFREEFKPLYDEYLDKAGQREVQRFALRDGSCILAGITQPGITALLESELEMKGVILQ